MRCGSAASSATESFRQALAVYREIGSPAAARVAAAPRERGEDSDRKG